MTDTPSDNDAPETGADSGGDEGDSPASDPLDAVESGPRASDGVEDPVVPAPDTEATHPSIVSLREKFGDVVLRDELHAGDEHVVFVERDRLREVIRWLKEDPEQHYEFLLDVTAVDYGGGRPIQVVYQLWSLAHHRMLRLKVELPIEDLRVASVQPLWKTANWLEREVYDLFGVTFEGHPDLRRILMPEHYAEGHPLRKDFPLRGRFSRAEQTRRALSQHVEDSYIPEEMEIGRDPQLVGADAEKVKDDFGEAAEGADDSAGADDAPPRT